MKLSRGLALMLIVFGSLFGVLGPVLTARHGPAASSFEQLRRYQTALARAQIPLAATLGVKTLALARTDRRWSGSELADLEYRVARSAEAAGRKTDALELARSAQSRLGGIRDADTDLVIRVASAHGDFALAAGNVLEAACAYGRLLERVGADRVEHPEQRLRPAPELQELTRHLDSLGDRFANATPSGANVMAGPPTTCNLTAEFYAERGNGAAASAVSEAVLAEAKNDRDLSPEIRGALLQKAAHIAEAGGDVATAKARLTEAIAVLDGEEHKAALSVALESLATLLTNWSDAKGARPVLARAIKLREQAYGTRHPSLISPLIALGYTQLDTDDTASAEITFKSALDIAQSEYSGNPGAALEAMLALGELYRDEGRQSEASALRAKTDQLRRSGVALRPSDVEDVPIEIPASKSRLAMFEIPFLGSEATSSGHIEVALAAPASAQWARAWDNGVFTPASETFLRPLVYAPKSDPNAAQRASAATLIFIPGQGTALQGNAARLARLQALIGPGEKPVLIDWTGTPAAGTGLRDAAAERTGRRTLENLFSSIAANDDGAPLTLLAEGCGAALLAGALDHASSSERAATGRRLARLVLIAPDIEAKAFAALLARIDTGHVHVVVYSARTAQPLLVAREVFGARPIGLDPARLSHIAGIETVEVGIGSDQMSFRELSSEALIADIANIVRGDPPAAKRCGLAHISEPGAGDIFVLDPKGCAPKVN